MLIRAFLRGDDGHDGFGTEDRRCLLGGSRTSAQWKRYKNVSGLYRPVSWRGNSYVHNFSDNRQPMKPSYGGNRGNMAVTLPAPSRGQRPVEVGKPQQDSNPDKSIL